MAMAILGLTCLKLSAVILRIDLGVEILPVAINWGLANTSTVIFLPTINQLLNHCKNASNMSRVGLEIGTFGEENMRNGRILVDEPINQAIWDNMLPVHERHIAVRPLKTGSNLVQEVVISTLLASINCNFCKAMSQLL